MPLCQFWHQKHPLARPPLDHQQQQQQQHKKQIHQRNRSTSSLSGLRGYDSHRRTRSSSQLSSVGTSASLSSHNRTRSSSQVSILSVNTTHNLAEEQDRDWDR